MICDNSKNIITMAGKTHRKYEKFLQRSIPQKTYAIAFILLSGGIGRAVGSFLGVVPVVGVVCMAAWAVGYIVAKDVFYRIYPQKEISFCIGILGGAVSYVEVAGFFCYFVNIEMSLIAMGSLFLLSMGSLMLLWIIGLVAFWAISAVQEKVNQSMDS